MSDPILRLPRVDEAAEFERAHRLTSPDDPSFLHFYHDGMSLLDYLNVLAKQRAGTDLSPGYVPETFLFAFVDSRIVGRIAIRHALTPRLEREGVGITMPLTVEEWGERAFQVRDPNGIIVQLVDWNATPSA